MNTIFRALVFIYLLPFADIAAGAASNQQTEFVQPAVPGKSALPGLGGTQLSLKTNVNKPLTIEESRHLIARTGIGIAPSQLVLIKGMTRGEAQCQPGLIALCLTTMLEKA